MAKTTLSPAQRLLLEYKIHLMPDAYARSDGAVREQMETGWEGALRLVEQMAGLPEPGVRWWARQPAGHILLTAGRSGYVPGPLAAGGRSLSGVATISLSLLVRQPTLALALALHPLDHLLGCRGALDGRWLSHGGGVSKRWQRVGQEIARLFPLGYGLSPAARRQPHMYLAEGLAAALTDRRRLNVADPKLDRLLHSSLLSVGFWRHFVQEEIG